MKTYILTEHATRRFISRSKALGYQVPPNIEKTLQKLLRSATEETVSPMHRTLRLINNHYKDATYLINSGWRFVISDDGITVITIERVSPLQNYKGDA